MNSELPNIDKCQWNFRGEAFQIFPVYVIERNQMIKKLLKMKVINRYNWFFYYMFIHYLKSIKVLVE